MKHLWLLPLLVLLLGNMWVELGACSLLNRFSQNERMRKLTKNWFWPFTLALTHAAVVYILLANWRLWWVPVGIFTFHAGVEVIHKIYKDNRLPATLFRQAAYLFARICLFLIWLALGLNPPVWMQVFPAVGMYGVVFLLAFALLFPIGGRLIGAFMAPFQAQITKYQETKPKAPQAIGTKKGLLQKISEQVLGVAPETDEVEISAQPAPNSSGLEDGGRVIGYLERLLIFLFLLANQFAAIGFLVAAKSIFRFGEFKDSENRMQAEYIIIGTFSSFIYAILVGMAARWLIG